ncbi:aminoglycoside phosphotransferase [Nocardiopsis sp. FR26]|uniref:aminoglycoside phosphotransferase n=1 Tax=Nocardiopsis sp. FR26 TaxID=2605987 RepID=UPI001F3E9DF1|nr:aminoglycoside phosphotransferase [Nocardiopsis sp. FR26]
MTSAQNSTPLVVLDDLSTVDINDVVDQAERRLGRRLLREDAHHSRSNGTAGFRTDADTWVRLGWRRSTHVDVPSWTGTEEAAAVIRGVPRPAWIAAATWSDPGRGVVWKAEETSLAPASAVSATAEVVVDPRLPESWWSDLKAGLAALGEHTTDRRALEQTHLTRRVHEVYGTGVDTRVPDDAWACAHGDLGYANLTGPELVLLDWESWGMAPVGWDAACLWSASLGVPDVADRVVEEFAEPLFSKSGLLCRLLLCANIARATRRAGRDLPLTGVMAATADTLLTELADMP